MLLFLFNMKKGHAGDPSIHVSSSSLDTAHLGLGGLGIHRLSGKTTWHHLQRGSCVAGTPVGLIPEPCCVQHTAGFISA